MANIIKGVFLAVTSAPMLGYAGYIMYLCRGSEIDHKAMGGLLMLMAFSGLMALAAIMMIMAGIREKRMYEECENGMVRLQEPIQPPMHKPKGIAPTWYKRNAKERYAGLQATAGSSHQRP